MLRRSASRWRKVTLSRSRSAWMRRSCASGDSALGATIDAVAGRQCLLSAACESSCSSKPSDLDRSFEQAQLSTAEQLELVGVAMVAGVTSAPTRLRQGQAAAATS